MGKNKDQKVELLNAFSRMNYLYQASLVASKTVPNSVLGNYYGKLMKEVSKKVVEKIHPCIKRSLCSSCCYPLFAGCNYASCKVKPLKKKQSKRKKVSKNCSNVKIFMKNQNKTHIKNYPTYQKAKKNIKPNKVIWTCQKCGYLRSFLQRPDHELWIDKCESDDEND